MQAIVDAKYKRLADARFPNADAYQMLAYCSGFRLSEGTLVYAHDSEAEDRVHHLINGTTIRVRTVDVEAEPNEVLRQVDALAGALIVSPRPPAVGDAVSGHLFVVHGDLLGIACDAVLVPSGSQYDGAGDRRMGHVRPAWHGVLRDAVHDGFLLDAPDRERSVIWVFESDGIRRPAVWAGFTGDRPDEPLEFYTRVVDAFVQEAGRHARVSSSHGARPLMSERPLLGLPLVGGGAGVGAATAAGS